MSCTAFRFRNAPSYSVIYILSVLDLKCDCKPSFSCSKVVADPSTVHQVWCACIRRDDWSTCRVDAPADELHTKMFFRLIDLVHVMGEISIPN